MSEDKKYYHDIYDVVAKNIRKYRKEANLTQEELAEKANYSHQFIRKIEAPSIKNTFSLDTIYCLSKALNKPFSDMFIEEDIEENEKVKN